MVKPKGSRIEDLARCGACGGRCCILSPGRFSPVDLDRHGGCTVQVIEELLEKGVAAITGGLVGVMGSALAPVLTLAAQGVDRPVIDLFRENNIRCVSLLVMGCAFSLEERPYECAAIIPSATECKLPDDVFMEDLWVDHQDVLKEIVEKQKSHSWIKEFEEQLYNHKRNDKFIQDSRSLVMSRGMAKEESEIRTIVGFIKFV